MVFINSIFNLINFNTDLINELYNKVLPISIIVFLAFVEFVSLKNIIILLITLNTIVIYTNDPKVNLVLYILCVILMMFKAIKLSGKSSQDMKKSPLYIIYSIDLLFSAVSIQLSQINYNWQQSKYIGYIGFIGMFVFLLNLILTHVYLRRFFSY
jgi:F0F1-type ATP synthase membrane subunit a